MGKYCKVCNKRAMTGNKVSHSDRKSLRKWAPNIQRVRATVDGRPVRLLVCTSCLRSGRVTRTVSGPVAVEAADQ